MDAWDERKRVADLAKHGVDFRTLGPLAWDEALIWEHRRRAYGEERLIALVDSAFMPWCSPSGTGHVGSSPLATPIAGRSSCMKRKLVRPTPEDDARIAAAIAADADAAPDLSRTRRGLVRRIGRPPAADPKEAISIRLDPDIVAHFRATGPGWHSRINAALRRVARLRRRG